MGSNRLRGLKIASFELIKRDTIGCRKDFQQAPPFLQPQIDDLRATLPPRDGKEVHGRGEM